MIFNLEYIISLAAALGSAYIISSGGANINTFIGFFLIPLLVAYITVQVINNLFPSLNMFGKKVGNYVEDRAIDRLNRMGFIQIFPPLLIVAFIFFFMLYNRNLG